MSTSTVTTPHFQLEKGNKFTIDKGIKLVRLGLGWNVAENSGENFDPDASVIGLIHTANGKAKFYGETPGALPPYAVTYANESLKKVPPAGFGTADGAITHTGDDRTGGKGEDDEVINIDFSKVNPDVQELAVWVTIYDAKKRNQNFGMMKNSYITITDISNNVPLAQYKLREEFADATAVQVGSFIHNGNNWEFQAVGAGSQHELGDVLSQYE